MKVIPLVNMFIMEELDSFSKYTHTEAIIEQNNYRLIHNHIVHILKSVIKTCV